jgi:hypothetical protein
VSGLQLQRGRDESIIAVQPVGEVASTGFDVFEFSNVFAIYAGRCEQRHSGPPAHRQHPRRLRTSGVSPRLATPKTVERSRFTKAE